MEQVGRLVEDLTPHTPQGQLLGHQWSELAAVCGRGTAVSLIVNTTPLGMSPNIETTPWSEKLPFPSRAFVYDLVYNPAETTFVKQAREGGCSAVTGLGMLLHQGAQAFQLWTGQAPDRQIMAAAIIPSTNNERHTMLGDQERRMILAKIEALAATIHSRNQDLSEEEADAIADRFAREVIEEMVGEGKIKY
jgi:hypothetical protein